MPIISFSEKKDELISHVKIETTRLWTRHRWDELMNALENNKRLFIWWKSRVPSEKEKLFEAHVHELSIVGFVRLNTGRGPWPWWGEVEVQDKTPVFWPKLRMTEAEVAEYVRNEGMKDLDEFLAILGKKNNTRVRYDGSIVGVPLIRLKFGHSPANNEGGERP